MKRNPQYPGLLFFSILEKQPGVSHFSTTRKGGVSTGNFQSMNLGNYSDDNPLHIYENRAILARMFHKEPQHLITPNQTHGSNVLLIDKEFNELPNSEKIERLYGYDASITQEKNYFLCVATADCVPILLYDPKNRAIAAVHAGWRGTSGRIVEKTIQQMSLHFKTDAKEIIAAIGPAIGINNYEVGSEVEDELTNNGYSLDRTNSYRNPKTQKLHIDLKEINKQELLRLGIPLKQIEKTKFCTFKNDQLFFSARRQTIRSGRMLTGIMLK